MTYCTNICFQGEAVYKQVEIDACRVAKGLGAEYWAVSSKTGDNVEALFLRVAALTFNQAVVREVSSEGNCKDCTLSKFHINLLSSSYVDGKYQ